MSATNAPPMARASQIGLEPKPSARPSCGSPLSVAIASTTPDNTNTAANISTSRRPRSTATASVANTVNVTSSRNFCRP
ncbi:hypothetical protein ACQEUV_06920 [Micromonospora aurantiaca (nom. illeg.)]|uniref:hypothetical protein n=1 Tax=Micromonospora aurantiaca (nom. illeg.) TaxID=47850 RepID=UPI003DA60138